MLINHDFDWEADLEESPRPGVDPTSGNVLEPDPAPRRPGGQVLPSDQVVIIERRRGFSRSTLLLALVALALSATSRIPKTPRPDNAAFTIDHRQLQSERGFPVRAKHHVHSGQVWQGPIQGIPDPGR